MVAGSRSAEGLLPVPLRTVNDELNLLRIGRRNLFDLSAGDNRFRADRDIRHEATHSFGRRFLLPVQPKVSNL
jgi:hypothetical protein